MSKRGLILFGQYHKKNGHCVMRAQGYFILFISQLDERSRLPAVCIASFPLSLQLIRVAQRITRSATNREIAGSNPVTDNEIFFLCSSILFLLKF